ncbi:hypothetical protein [Terricaulis sp.]|uniref:hypothetical protein n=1 Tax=Terricaulis sp. TaxID=2768686 RepID=UPI0037847E06
MKRAAASKGAAAPRLADPLAQALGEAAWAEADQALAAALSELADLESALRAGDARSAEDALLMGLQALNQVARKRGIARFGDVGEAVAFDGARHELAGGGASKNVKITRPGLERGGVVLVKARVAAARASRKARA